MKRIKITLLFVLITIAAACAYMVIKPFAYSATKAHQMHTETKAFYLEADLAQQAAAEEQIIPYEDLLLDIQKYNQDLYLTMQSQLSDKQAYQTPPFDLVQYGLPDNTFGVLSIPKMELEMPLYLGATDENMANGAAVLSQTSIPIGGVSSNAVIAGHRGWNGYKYMKEIELLEAGDEVLITNVWGTLTYKVSEIRIINPNEIDAILIQPNRDLITLLTCHPYGSGGLYRYLVFCDRAEDDLP